MWALGNLSHDIYHGKYIGSSVKGVLTQYGRCCDTFAIVQIDSLSTALLSWHLILSVTWISGENILYSLDQTKSFLGVFFFRTSVILPSLDEQFNDHTVALLFAI